MVLILSRRQDESITIRPPGGPDIVIHVLGTGGGGQVRLGLAAPIAVRIYRTEILAEYGDAPFADGPGAPGAALAAASVPAAQTGSTPAAAGRPPERRE